MTCYAKLLAREGGKEARDQAETSLKAPIFRVSFGFISGGGTPQLHVFKGEWN